MWHCTFPHCTIFEISHPACRVYYAFLGLPLCDRPGVGIRMGDGDQTGRYCYDLCRFDMLAPSPIDPTIPVNLEEPVVPYE
jgi:hypothetical protein